MYKTRLSSLPIGFFVILWLLCIPTCSTVGAEPQKNSKDEKVSRKTRILYIVTSLAEYNSGSRETVAGSDRFQQTILPVIRTTVDSMLQSGFEVDVFLICHYTFSRQDVLRSALPASVGLQVWNDASPIFYDTGGKNAFTKLYEHTVHLSRQHRFVIKDKIMHYDVFVNFEDDMIIKGEHVHHYIAVSNELQRLQSLAPDQIPSHESDTNTNVYDNYYGQMTKEQLKRMIPGFMRVEVLLDEEHYPAQSSTGPVPVDLEFQNGQKKQSVDSSVCCHVPSYATTSSDNSNPVLLPPAPRSDQIMIWETNIFPLGVRKMPDSSWLQWVVMQRGPNQSKLNKTQVIGDYWSNRHANYWPEAKHNRPAGLEFKYVNNQGGWMATREQLLTWHAEICPGGFLPPYDIPHYHYDGLDMRNVEWYSGGLHLCTVRHACNLQRILLMDPFNFSKSLVYHSANNKQKQLSYKREEFFVKANTLLGQLNTIKKQAESEIQEISRSKNKNKSAD